MGVPTTLEPTRVREPEQEELRAIVESTREAIVMVPRKEDLEKRAEES